jgi:hypothetical protein
LGIRYPSFQTAVVAPGEIEDRYRTANAVQGFGYTLGILAGDVGSHRKTLSTAVTAMVIYQRREIYVGRAE